MLRLTAFVHNCPQCARPVNSWLDYCPECSVRISSPGRIRALGWMLLVVGTGLSAGVAYLLVVIHRIIQGSADPDATTRFTGTAAQALMVYALLTVVLLFGIVAVASGAWQVRYGVRNPRLVKIVLGFAAVFIGIGMVVQILG